MSSLKIIVVSILSCLAGVLAGFGTYSVSIREAVASVSSPPGSAAVNAAITPGLSPAFPGSSFVSDVYKAVSPAVVHITNRAVVRHDFWHGAVEGENTGSGVIIDPQGHILTNWHVIDRARLITVVLHDGGQYQATLVGVDPSTDLALLKIDSDKPLPVATLGDSDRIEVGEWVVAIGNPMGLDWTVTTGIVSALGRQGDPAHQGGPTIPGLIQTDAAINPGNSGGPLLNVRGEVIGINERIFSQSGGSIGIGLAVPINTAKDILDDLKQHGRVVRPWLGFSPLAEITPQWVRRYELPVNHGLIVQHVAKPSPASLAGMIPYQSDRRTQQFQYDIVTKANGREVRSRQQLLDLVRNGKQGEKVSLEVHRVVNGRFSVVNIEATLSEWPNDERALGFI